MSDVICQECGSQIRFHSELQTNDEELPGAGLPGNDRSTLSKADWNQIRLGYRRIPAIGYTKVSEENQP